MKHVAVLLTVHNRRDKTMECLSRLYMQKIPQGFCLEVFLTDDGCTDGTPEAICEQYPDVNIIKGDGNLYWNRGMYVAWNEAAKGNPDCYLWLNDDTYVYPFMLSTLLSAAQETNNEAIIVGATHNAAHTNVTYGGRLQAGVLAPVDGTLQEVSYFNGNIVLVPRAVYQQLGKLDWYFTHSKGDFDYGMRATAKGIAIYQTGKVLGECEQHESLDKWCDPSIPFTKRWKLLHRPNGMPPKETFYFEKRHKGLLLASFHYVTVHLRCLFPQIWTYRKT